MSAEGAEEREESATGKEQACSIDQAGETALVDARNGIEAGMFGGGNFRGRRWGIEIRVSAWHGRNRNVDKHFRFVGAAFGGTTNGDSEREIVIERRSFSYRDRARARSRRSFRMLFERQLGLAAAGRIFSPTRAIRSHAIGKFAAPNRVSELIGRGISAGWMRGSRRRAGVR